MSEITNPPAFPIRDLNEHPGPTGMTLRDWFAGHAPITIADAALVGGWNETETFSDDLTRGIMFSTLALMRYEYADAMLNERSRERAK